MTSTITTAVRSLMDPLRVEEAKFASVETLTSWQRALDRRGLRATGSPAHNAYIDDLVDRLTAIGVQDVRLDHLPLNRWTPHTWSLTVDGAAARVLAPIAYSGSTSANGVTGTLSTTPTPGVIGVAEIAVASLTARDFDALDWGAPTYPMHDADYSGDELYERVWLSQDQMRAELDRFADAGAAALVLIVDQPGHTMVDPYLLYDGVHRGIPAVFADRTTGARLLKGARNGTESTLTLTATVEAVTTPNIVGFIPGTSDEVVVVQSHTDGTNGLEDNGPEAIIAIASYLTSVPEQERARGVLVLLSTGHFATHTAWGMEAFLLDHHANLVPKIAAALSLEHLGALPAPSADTELGSVPAYEFGCAFSSPHPAMIQATRRALEEAQVTEARVLRPFVPDTTGRSPDGLTWPGDGGPFWHTAGVPSMNFISGPPYLFDNTSVSEFIDIAALRRQAIAFTNLVLELMQLPLRELRRTHHDA